MSYWKTFLGATLYVDSKYLIRHQRIQNLTKGNREGGMSNKMIQQPHIVFNAILYPINTIQFFLFPTSMGYHVFFSIFGAQRSKRGGG